MKPVPIGKVQDTIREFLAGKDSPVLRLMKARGTDPFRVLVSTILSARTNDKTTAPVTKRLFKIIKSPNDLEKKSLQQIEQLIYPVSFYKNKAKYLKALPAFLKDGVPRTLEGLIALPGVGRKTAGIVLVESFDTHAISVDIHVHRISNRLGYVKTKTPYETEMALQKKLPKKYWKTYNRTLVAFGQLQCTPASPKCSTCPARKYCNRVGVTRSR